MQFEVLGFDLSDPIVSSRFLGNFITAEATREKESNHIWQMPSFEVEARISIGNAGDGTPARVYE